MTFENFEVFLLSGALLVPPVVAVIYGGVNIGRWFRLCWRRRRTPSERKGLVSQLLSLAAPGPMTAESHRYLVRFALAAVFLFAYCALFLIILGK